MLIHEHDGNGVSDVRNTRPDEAAGALGMTRRMRRGVSWTAGGIIVLAILTLIATGGLAVPGGVKMSASAWIISLSTGVVLSGIGFAVIVDEAARLNREEVEADRLSQGLHDRDRAEGESFNGEE